MSEEKPSTINFNRKEVRAYCDRLIEHWRETRHRAAGKGNEEDILIADCYIDAYQSLRISFFGQSLLKKEKNN